jgi:type II secretory pathway predicted ATPase ExeA
MYCDHFGLSQKPFEVSPDPEFIYFNRENREVLASLIYGIRQRRGFMTVVGEVGTGKTTILNTLLERLGASHRCAVVFYGGSSFQTFLNHVLVQLRLAVHPSRLPVHEAIERLHDFAKQQYRRGGNVVLILDEAQNLDRDLLEQIRLLSNLETQKHKLLQIVLCGQVELDDHLSRHDLRQLTQRINLKRYVSAMNYKDTLAYIQHRLQLAGYQGPRLFSERALRLIRMESGGIPRKINVLCDNALITAFGLGRQQIDDDILREVIRDLRSGSAFSRVLKNELERGVQKICSTLFKRSRSDTPVRTTVRNLLHRFFPISGYRMPFVICLLLIIGAVLIAWPGLHRGLSASTESIHERRDIEDVAKTSDIFRIAESKMDFSAKPQQNEMGGIVAHAHTVHYGKISHAIETADSMPNHPLPVESAGASRSNENAQIVIVKKGDNLAAILRETYGVYNEDVLWEVLRANREIENINKINVGQIIFLPSLGKI